MKQGWNPAVLRTKQQQGGYYAPLQMFTAVTVEDN